MAGRGPRSAIERAEIGHSRPTGVRACALLDLLFALLSLYAVQSQPGVRRRLESHEISSHRHRTAPPGIKGQVNGHRGQRARQDNGARDCEERRVKGNHRPFAHGVGQGDGATQRAVRGAPTGAGPAICIFHGVHPQHREGLHLEGAKVGKASDEAGIPVAALIPYEGCAVFVYGRGVVAQVDGGTPPSQRQRWCGSVVAAQCLQARLCGADRCPAAVVSLDQIVCARGIKRAGGDTVSAVSAVGQNGVVHQECPAAEETAALRRHIAGESAVGDRDLSGDVGQSPTGSATQVMLLLSPNCSDK
jgi:hypothetical protein